MRRIIGSLCLFAAALPFIQVVKDLSIYGDIALTAWAALVVTGVSLVLRV